MKNDLFNFRRVCGDGASSPARRSGQHLQEESIGKDNRVLRGGSWNNAAEFYLRSSCRLSYAPRGRSGNYGFRCVLSVGWAGVPVPPVRPIPAAPAPQIAATKENPFSNSLGMKFAPVKLTGGPTDGKSILFSIWETRRMDYAAYTKGV